MTTCGNFSGGEKISKLMEINNKTEAKNNLNLDSEQKKSHSKIMSIILVPVILLSAFFGSVFGFMAGTVSQNIPEGKKLSQLFNLNSGTQEVIKQRVVEDDSAIIDVVNKATPAVVSIIITKDVPRARNFFFGPFDNFFDPFGQEQGNDRGIEKQQIGGGSGFFVSSDGMIATNKHVVSDISAEYTVITSDGKEYAAKILARDPINDIAVIKIDGENFTTLNFGDSSSLQTGQTVVAIGNSLGEFSNTVSRGIISGLRRNVTAGSGLGGTERLTNIIQTDAAINPGNSGGPLLNVTGDIIGINVAMAQGAQNIGFAIPANQVKKVIDQVRTTGKITTPYIGVRYMAITNSIQKSNNLPYNYGVLVARGTRMEELAVIPGSPADKAGLQENDVILELNGTKIDNEHGLSDLIAQYNVGETIKLKIWRKGETKDINVVLEERK